MTIKNLLILLLILGLVTVIIFQYSQPDYSQLEIKQLKEDNRVLVSKLKESALKLTTEANKRKESEAKIKSIELNQSHSANVHHKIIDSVRTFDKSDAYHFLVKRYITDTKRYDNIRN